MNHFFTLILIICLTSCSENKKSDCNYIKDYYQVVYKADLEFETENYEKAFKLYQDAFNSCKAKNTIGYDELGKFTESSAIIEKFDITYKYAKK